MHVDMRALSDGGGDLLDGVGHASEADHLLIKQGTPLPLPHIIRRRYILTSLVIRADRLNPAVSMTTL